MSYQIIVEPSGLRFTAEPGQSVLEAALAQDVPLKHGCASGSCGDCKGKILEGDGQQGAFLPLLLSPEERAAGAAILCKFKPESDLRIQAELTRAEHWQAGIVALEALAADVMGLWLKPDRAFPFIPGQYLRVEIPGHPGVWRSYSLAHRPRTDGLVGLQIRRAPDGLFSTQLFGQLKMGDKLTLSAAQGEFRLHPDSPRDILCIAAGTGLAPIEAILEEAFALDLDRRIHLFFGAKRERDLYHVQKLEAWAREHPNFSFTPTVSDPDDSHWAGARRLLPTVMQHGPWQDHEVYLCGSPGMIEAALELLRSHHSSMDRMHFDAFTPN